MAAKIRNIPPICLTISLFGLLTGKLKYSPEHLGKTIKMEDGSRFIIFRQATEDPGQYRTANCIFIVRFKFARLSHRVNKLVSIIPMLIITGFPGFMTKIYAVNPDNGFWQGMYQWKSTYHLDKYKNSMIFKIMNKRAISDSMISFVLTGQSINDFIDDHVIGSE